MACMRRALIALAMGTMMAAGACGDDDGGGGGSLCSLGTEGCGCHPGFGCEAGLACNTDGACVSCSDEPGLCSADAGM